MSSSEMSATLPLPLAWPLSRRWVNALGSGACVAMLGFGYFLQFGLGLEPCPLCILQRLAILATAVVFLVAALHNPAGWGHRVYAGLLTLTLGSGIALSSRHSWLQYFHTGDEAGLCGMSLEYMLDVLSPWEIIKTVLKGTGDCTRIDWSFLGLSIPAWTLICFVVLAAIGITRNWQRD